jgi:hypothetical protein
MYPVCALHSLYCSIYVVLWGIAHRALGRAFSEVEAEANVWPAPAIVVDGEHPRPALVLQLVSNRESNTILMKMMMNTSLPVWVHVGQGPRNSSAGGGAGGTSVSNLALKM